MHAQSWGLRPVKKISFSTHLDAKIAAMSALPTASTSLARYASGVSSSKRGFGGATGVRGTHDDDEPGVVTTVPFVPPPLEFRLLRSVTPFGLLGMGLLSWRGRLGVRLLVEGLCDADGVVVPPPVEDEEKKFCESLRSNIGWPLSLPLPLPLPIMLPLVCDR